MTATTRLPGDAHPGDDEIFFDTWLQSAAGCAFLAEAHWERITRSWAFFDLPGRPDRAGIEREVTARARCCQGPPWRVRVGFAAGGGRPDWALRVESISPEEVCPRRPWRVARVEVATISDPPTCAHKTLRNRHWADALALARRQGLDDALLAVPGGRLAEFSRGNLFILEGRRLVTPPVETPLLPGVMRQALLDWPDMESRSEPIDWPRLLAADGVLMTNSVRLLVPVGEIVATGRVHPLRVSARLTGMQAHWRRHAMAPGQSLP